MTSVLDLADMFRSGAFNTQGPLGTGVSDLAGAIKPQNLPQFRIAQITDTTGLGEQEPGHVNDGLPPTVTLDEGDFQIEARIAGNPWDYHPGDTVIYAPIAGSPTVLNKLPIIGTNFDEGEGDPWHFIGDPGEPAFQNGWSNSGGSLDRAAYRKQSDGWTVLKGTVTGGADGTKIFDFLQKGDGTALGTIFGTLAFGTGPKASALFINSQSVFHHSGAQLDTNLSLNGIMFPTKVNLMRWEHLPLERGWETVFNTPNNAPLIFRRDDGWVYMNGNIRNGNTSPANYELIRMPTNSSKGVKAVIKSVVDDTFGATGNMARLHIGGSDSAQNRRPDTIRLANAGAAITDLLLTGVNWWSWRERIVRTNLFIFGEGDPDPSIEMGTSLTLLNGWAHWGSDTIGPKYRKDVHQRVHLEGSLDPSGATSTIIAILPPGFRPVAELPFLTSEGANSPVRLNVQADGTIAVQSIPGTGLISLDGLHFLAEQ